MKISFLGKRKSNCLFSFIIMLVASLAISCSGNDEFDAQPEDPQTRATLESDAFVTEWVVPEGGVVTLPIDSNYQYSCIIDWGDDCSLTYIFNRADYNSNSHKYVEAGTYRIKIIGIYPSWCWMQEIPCKHYLTKIVQWGNVHFQVLHDAFSGCSNLVSIPTGIPNVTDYSFAFYACSKLTSLPDELFVNSTNGQDFSSTFSACGLTTLPPNLFKNCFNARSFLGTFLSSSLMTLPSDLFKDCYQVTDFSNTFGFCSNLTTIPEDLFSSCTEVSTFAQTFFWNQNLTSIPTTLFANCKKVTSFNQTFMLCFALTGETPVSDGLELWQRAKEVGYPDVIDGSGCFSGCTGLNGFPNSIDLNWR